MQRAYNMKCATKATTIVNPTPPLNLLAAPLKATVDDWKGLGPVGLLELALLDVTALPDGPAGDVPFPAG